MRRLPRLLLVPVLALTTIVAVAPATPSAAAVTIDGPDVSSYQHPNGASINWAAVAKSGREFAIVKATEGTSYVNKYFKADYAGIRKAGMVRGSYHFARPSHPVADSALKQAKFYVAHIGTTTTTKTLPPALDLEITGGLSKASLVTWAQDFLLDVRALTGRTPMLYTYPWFWSHQLGDANAFKLFPLWMASYSSSVDVGATLWQYTAGATVKGIKGRVDMSKLVADPATWNAMTDGTALSDWPAAAPDVPTAVHVTPGVGSATISWLPPNAGSSRITSYRATLTLADGTGDPQSIVVGSPRSSATFTGLSHGTPYLLTVNAHSAVGTGPTSTAQMVVPQWPTALAVSNSASTLTYGQPLTLTATLTRSDNTMPLADEVIHVSQAAHGSSHWADLGTVTTDANGVVTKTFTPMRNEDLRLSFHGATGLAPVAVVRTVWVRPAVSSVLSATTVAARHSVVLTGGIVPRSYRVPVVVEILRSGHWHVLARKLTGPHGGFRFVLTPLARGTKHYRVVVSATSSHLLAFGPVVTAHVV